MPPFSVSLINRLAFVADRFAASTTSLPPRVLTAKVSNPSSPVMFTKGNNPPMAMRVPKDAIWIASLPAVPLMMTESLALSPTPVPNRYRGRGSCSQVGSGQVVDSNGVGAAAGVKVDLLDAVQVDGDVGGVLNGAEEVQAVAICGKVEVLGDV